jgi:signal transduction histidine kinase/FixJ family two-component response regulator
MRPDLLTLFASATVLITFVGAVLCCSGRDGVVRTTLRPWGFSVLLGAAGLGLMGAAAGWPGFIAHDLPNALIIGATGLAWAAARAFDKRRTRWIVTLGGAAAWLVACQALLPDNVLAGPVVTAGLLTALASALCAAYLAAAARSLWRGRLAEPMPSRAMAAGLLAVHAAVAAARGGAALLDLLPAGASMPLPTGEGWAALLLVEAQLHAVGLAMALLAMAKERAERRASAALVAARDAADSASAAKSRFVAHLSHELRTPMGAVLGMAQALAADTALSADQKLKADVLERAGRHLVDVAGNVLDLAKAEAGRLDMASEVVPLDELLLDCLALNRASAEAKGVRLGVVTDHAAPTAVLADATRLRQVVLNLLSNAVKFTPRDGSVELRVCSGSDGTTLRIEVEDTGPGVPTAMRDRLFREFSQIGGTASAGGTGLGLAISLSLMQAMRGRIGHRPAASGTGSIFWIELPAARPARDRQRGAAPPVPAPATPAAPIPTAARKLRLLVVDDVATNRLSARFLLQRLGHDVAEAEGGEQAVSAVARGNVDAVLMDANMAGIDGLEATRRIRALAGAAGRVPILAFTADLRPAFVQDCLAAGMDGCLAKPLDGAAVADALLRVHAGKPWPDRPAGEAQRSPAAVLAGL